MRLRKWIAIVVMLFVLSGLCLGTAIDFRPRKYDNGSLIQATIAKSDVPNDATREQITYKLVTIWMDSHGIGTFGWTNWLWTYKIGSIDATSTVCGTVDVHLIPFLPEGFTFWTTPYTAGKKYGEWYSVGGFMALHEDKDYYYLVGPFSLC